MYRIQNRRVVKTMFLIFNLQLWYNLNFRNRTQTVDLVYWSLVLH